MGYYLSRVTTRALGTIISMYVIMAQVDNVLNNARALCRILVIIIIIIIHLLSHQGAVPSRGKYIERERENKYIYSTEIYQEK